MCFISRNNLNISNIIIIIVGRIESVIKLCFYKIKSQNLNYTLFPYMSHIFDSFAKSNFLFR